jgi:hypothetical protein
VTFFSACTLQQRQQLVLLLLHTITNNSGKVASTTLISSTVGGLAGIYMQRKSTDVLPDGSKEAWMTASATVSVQLQANTAGRRTVANTLVQVSLK